MTAMQELEENTKVGVKKCIHFVHRSASSGYVRFTHGDRLITVLFYYKYVCVIVYVLIKHFCCSAILETRQSTYFIPL